MRATPSPDVQVDERPESSATCRAYHVRRYSSAAATCAGVGSTGAPSTLDAVEQRNAQVAVLADDPGLDAPGRDAERPGQARPQAQAVVERVAEDAPPVEAGALLQPRHERIDRDS